MGIPIPQKSWKFNKSEEKDQITVHLRPETVLARAKAIASSGVNISKEGLSHLS